eukprot:36505_1
MQNTGEQISKEDKLLLDAVVELLHNEKCKYVINTRKSLRAKQTPEKTINNKIGKDKTYKIYLKACKKFNFKQLKVAEITENNMKNIKQYFTAAYFTETQLAFAGLQMKKYPILKNILKKAHIKLNLPFYFDIKYGMVLDCTVLNIDMNNNKIMVTFCNGFIGHISILHCMETPPTSLECVVIKSKYTKGNIIKCRVLTCIAHKRDVNLTAKPSLVETTKDNKDPISIYSWNTPINTVSYGVIDDINDVNGYIVVSFYNYVSAVGYSKKPSDEFYIGQVIQIKVLECIKTQKRMICTLNLNDKCMMTDIEKSGIMVKQQGGKILKRKLDNNDGSVGRQKIMISSVKQNDSKNLPLYWCKIISKKNDCFIVKKIINYNENNSDNMDV